MSVLKRPIITEKSQGMNPKGKYSFEVSRDANKIQIASAVEKMYGVNVEKVSTLNQFGFSHSRLFLSKLI